MSLITVAWSMIASACLTLAAIYWLVWFRNRAAWSHLLFSLTSAATAGFAFGELWMMQAQTAGEFMVGLRGADVSLFLWLVSITWFVRIYLGAGRRWLAWAICGLRAVALLLNLLMMPNLDYREMTRLRHVPFLGASVTVAEGVPNPWMLVGQLAAVLLLVFVADASVTAWRRGDRRKALMVGGSVEFFLLTALATSTAVLWGYIQAPIIFSVLYLGMVTVMGYELSHDVLRASRLVQELRVTEAGLRESEARMSVALDAADFGIWIRDLARHEIWASAKWRELFGFGPSEHLDFNAILLRLHPDDREGLEQAHAHALAKGGRYETEYRLMLPDGGVRWISSRGRVEYDATGQPVLLRGVSRDVTPRKHAELAVRTLSGRLLSAQEEERRRIARELHDNVSQRMAVLAIRIGQVARSLGETAAARSLGELGLLVVETSTEIHNLSHRLHSSKLEMLGLVETLRGHCQELVGQGVHARFRADDVPSSLPPDVALCLFRIVQEGLNNVVKHSGAREADVTLQVAEGVLVLSVADAGCGFEQAGAAVQRGLGLASMRERLRLLGGELTVRSGADQGTTIIARLPIPAVSDQTDADIVRAPEPVAQVAQDAGDGTQASEVESRQARLSDGRP